MELHDEILTPAYIDNPSYGAYKHGDSGLIDTCQMACGYENIADNE
jgi:hypothetical protein